MPDDKPKMPLFIGFGFLFVAILVEMIAILRLNNGFFVYTLDDPYIHMALAEQIIEGHYGVNSGEFSAPSSSILWPFLIASFASFEYFPLLVNSASAMLTVFVFFQILNLSFGIGDKRIKAIFISLLLVLLILGTNTIGLIFTGMEHSLQLLLVTAVALGLIVEEKKNKVELWFLVAIAAAPLIRYENMAIALAALSYLFVCRYYKSAISVLLFIVVLVGGFSIFLTQVGLSPFPASVVLKSSVVASGGKLYSFVGHLKYSLTEVKGVLLSLGGLGLLCYVLFCEQKNKKHLLAVVTLFALVIHLLAGRYGWYNRYEVYIWSFSLLIFFYLLGGPLTKLLEGDSRHRNLIKVVIVAIGFVIVTSPRYISDLFSLPIAANNIYEQHYQMHRFAVHYHKKPVAVNDLGYVSYKNDNYVLDLWGLASREALVHRRSSRGLEWLNALAKSRDVELAMIYESWFDGLPEEWIKIGELHLGKRTITPASGTVSFFAMNQNAYIEIVAKLRSFIKTLPPRVEFTFVDNGG